MNKIFYTYIHRRNDTNVEVIAEGLTEVDAYRTQKLEGRV